MVTSPTADQWWSLFNLFVILGVTIGTTVVAFMVISAIKYRHKADKPEPEDTPKPGSFPIDRGKPKLVLMLSLITLTIVSTLIIGTFGAFNFLRTPPEEGMVIEVTGFQWAWKFRYPDGTETIGELVIPVNETIIFHVTSTDVKHKFGIPDFKIAADAIPYMTNVIWIKATSLGAHAIFCYELCGVGHASMYATMRVVSQEQFDQWLTTHSGG
jgi:cytochrome c oxidase subunit 2